MDPASSSSKLTFDILGHIFNHYAETETISHPLETLLLVCRSWSNAAFGHRTLWSHFNIHLSIKGPYPSTRIWKARLPLRLKRCGDTAPLHIDLRHLPTGFARSNDHLVYFERVHRINQPPDCPVRGGINDSCVRDTVLCVNDLLFLLAGKDGSLCRRWKGFHLDVRNPTDYGLEYSHFDIILRLPAMPNLTSLAVYGLVLWHESVVFPHAPLLQHFAAINPTPTLPLTVRSWNIVETLQGAMPTSATEETNNVEVLVLEGMFRVPKSMPKLWKLEIAGAINTPDNEGLQLPNLTHLTLVCREDYQLQNLFQSQGVDFSRLVSFGVYVDLSFDFPAFKGDVLEILRAAKNLSTIHGDFIGLSIVLKLVWETEMEPNELTRENGERGWRQSRLLGGQRILIEGEQGSALVLGDETRLHLCNVATQLRVDSPEVSWDDFLYRF